MPDTLTLLYQSHSPYARKVLVCAHELGLAERLASSITRPARPTATMPSLLPIRSGRCRCC